MLIKYLNNSYIYMETPSELKEEITRSEQQERVVERDAMFKLDPHGLPLRPQPTRGAIRPFRNSSSSLSP